MPVPVPLPTAPASVAWALKPLVKIDARLGGRPIAGWQRLLGGTSATLHIPVWDESVFTRTPAKSLTEAVSAASQLSAGVGRTIRDNVSKSGERFSPAVAVLQASDGAYWTAMLRTGTIKRYPGFASIDVGSRSLVIKDVQALHPDVKAVVGMNSWVNFTNETATPTLADPRGAAEVAAAS